MYVQITIRATIAGERRDEIGAAWHQGASLGAIKMRVQLQSKMPGEKDR